MGEVPCEFPPSVPELRRRCTVYAGGERPAGVIRCGRRYGMGRRWLLVLIALLTVFLLGGGCGLLFDYCSNFVFIHDCPEKIYPAYKAQLQTYAARLDAGDVYSEPNRGYSIPQYLIDHGAQYCTKHGDCYCISFGTFLDNPAPELWYSPTKFADVPPILSKVMTNPRARWKQLDTNWGSCYRP
jgi:hypothetical protein